MNKYISIFFSSLLFVSFAFGQELDTAKLNNYFDVLESKGKFMGSVALAKEGKIIYTKSSGYRDVENNIKADADTKYRIGSISKTFTAVLVFKAIAADLLSLDTPLKDYYPEITNADKITIEHLLNHRSGIHNFTNDADFLSWNEQAKTEAEMLAIIKNGGSDFSPDSKAEYSNSNYLLLSYILEKCFQKSYEQILEEQIIKPLGLERTHLGKKINPKLNEAYSYRSLGSWEKDAETDISIPIGAGGIVSTPKELVLFSEALFKGQLISKEDLTQMKTLQDNYGFGLFQIPFYGSIGYGHTGGIDSFTSVFSYFENGDISYALCSNGSSYNTNNISIAVLSAAYNKEFSIPSFSTTELSEEELKQYAGLYASEQIPLKITISVKDGKLIGQASGQAAFPLEMEAKDTFKYELVGLVIQFKPEENSFILKQGGGEFLFSKEN